MRGVSWLGVCLRVHPSEGIEIPVGLQVHPCERTGRPVGLWVYPSQGLWMHSGKPERITFCLYILQETPQFSMCARQVRGSILQNFGCLVAYLCRVVPLRQ